MNKQAELYYYKAIWTVLYKQVETEMRREIWKKKFQSSTTDNNLQHIPLLPILSTQHRGLNHSCNIHPSTVFFQVIFEVILNETQDLRIYGKCFNEF